MFLEPYSNVEEAFEIRPRSAENNHQIGAQFKKGKGMAKQALLHATEEQN
jgi:hypothetical protein